MWHYILHLDGIDRRPSVGGASSYMLGDRYRSSTSISGCEYNISSKVYPLGILKKWLYRGRDLKDVENRVGVLANHVRRVLVPFLAPQKEYLLTITRQQQPCRYIAVSDMSRGYPKRFLTISFPLNCGKKGLANYFQRLLALGGGVLEPGRHGSGCLGRVIA